jgi:hypothetical protein
MDNSAKWIHDYDSLAIDNLIIEYTNDSGLIYRIPFRSSDTVVNGIFGQAAVSVNYLGSVGGWFTNNYDYETEVFYKCYSKSKNELNRSHLSDFMSESIAFYSYKGLIQLCYLGC